MPTPITRFLRHFVRAAAFVLGVAATYLAGAIAALWGGPLTGLAVYFFAVVVFISVLTYLTE